MECKAIYLFNVRAWFGVFWRRKVERLPSQATLFVKKRQAPKRVTAVQREGMVEDMENAQPIQISF